MEPTGTYGRRAVAAAGGRRRRGSAGAGHAGGGSRVADLGAREAAAADDAIREPALGFLRARVRVRDKLAVVEVVRIAKLYCNFDELAPQN